VSKIQQKQLIVVYEKFFDNVFIWTGEIELTDLATMAEQKTKISKP